VFGSARTPRDHPEYKLGVEIGAALARALSSAGPLLVTGFPAEAFGTNCYVVAAGPGEQCLIVDPGIGVLDRLDEVIAEHRLFPAAVLLTHGHLDHTFSVVPVCGARDVPAWIHPDDRAQLTDPLTWIGVRPGTPFMGDKS